MTLLKPVPDIEICKAAAWTSLHAFFKHCALVHASRSDAGVFNAVLHSVLDLALKLPSLGEVTALGVT